MIKPRVKVWIYKLWSKETESFLNDTCYKKSTKACFDILEVS